MSGHPVPSRENHRDSRGAKVHPKSVTCKPWSTKFSTEFSTVAAPSPPKMVTLKAPREV